MTMGITSPTSTTGQILKNGSAVISFDANNNASFAGNVAPLYNPTMRNRIINGAMVIDQRNSGAAVTFGSTGTTYTLDRWLGYCTQTSKWTFQQNAGSVTTPSGFSKYLGITSSSAYSITSTDLFFLMQNIEGFNTADLNFGTANAQTITLSFWVRSSLTGTFGGAIQNSAQDRNYPFTFTINSANTWEQKSITVPGDTTGTWIGATNGIGLRVCFGLGVGSTYSGTAGAWTSSVVYGVTGTTSIVGTNGATFYITGVQLEAGSVATPFEQRLYGQELINCQRYYQKFISVNGAYCTFGTGHIDSATAGYGTIVLPVTTRAAATFGSSGSIAFYSGNSFYSITSFGTVYYTLNTQGVNFTCSGGGMTAGRGGQIIANNSTTAYVDFNAEL
jgi:hypothetical protein